MKSHLQLLPFIFVSVCLCHDVCTWRSLGLVLCPLLSTPGRLDCGLLRILLSHCVSPSHYGTTGVTGADYIVSVYMESRDPSSVPHTCAMRSLPAEPTLKNSLWRPWKQCMERWAPSFFSGSYETIKNWSGEQTVTSRSKKSFGEVDFNDHSEILV